MSDSHGAAPATKLQLTDQQRAALERRDASVSLSAGAGCGKTFVLTERYLLAIAPDGDAWDAAEALERVAAITFTDAAAREMRARIRKRLRQELIESPPDRLDAWRQLTRQVEAARISTFHSFCGALLRRFAVEADLDPQFELLDPGAAALLQVEAIDDLLRMKLAERNDDVLELAAEIGLESLQRALFTMLNSLSRLPEAETSRWAVQSASSIVDAWERKFVEEIVPLLLADLAQQPIVRALHAAADPEAVTKPSAIQHFSELRHALERLQMLGRGPAVDLRTIREALEQSSARAKVQGVCTAKDWPDPGAYQAYKQAADDFRKLVKNHALLADYERHDALAAARKGELTLSLACAARDALRERKRRRNQLDYDDLMLRTHTLLTNNAHMDAVRAALSGMSLLMVDEFQDTDPLQVELVRAICPSYRQQGLFVVGDAKQSIYRFRGAEPIVSRRLRSELPPDGRLALTANFRSQPEVVRFVNGLFADAIDDYEPLQATKPQVTGPPAVEFLWSSDPDQRVDAAPPGADERAPAEGAAEDGAAEDGADAAAPEKRSAAAKRKCEARWIAQRIVELLDQRLPVADSSAPGGRRPVRAGDVVILLRALSDVPLYEEALRQQGLAYHLSGGHAFYAQQEVYDVLNLLRAVVSSIDNLSLAGALRSPLFALTDETLYWLVETHGSLQQAIAVAEPPMQLDPLEASKFRRACATLAALRTQKDRLLVADLLQEAVARTGYDAALLAEFLGQRKLANLEKLLEQARELDRVSPGDLNGFITQLSEFVHRPPKEALAAVQAEGDVVRLMTIHNAKGLEFPVVVVADMGRGYAANRGEATLDREFGPVLPESGKENRVARSGWSLFKLREDREEAAERLRLLYVACTRAADYLILSAPYEDACGAPGGKQNDWLRLLSQRYDLQTGAWEGPVARDSEAPAQVRVTVSEPTGGRAPLGRPRGTDVLQVVAEARERAANARRPPVTAEPLGVAQRWRRGFSFSRLTGELLREGEEGDADLADVASNPRASATPLAAAARSSGDGDDALDLGRIVHRALERLDFANPTDAARLCREAADLRRVPQLADPAAEMLERFLAGPRVRQLAAARRVLREAPFLLPWSLPNDDGPPRRLEGVIDCLYLDAAGKWRLIDYKTNRIRPAQAAAAAARYELQLFVYAEAARQALGAPLAEVTLCFLAPGVEHAFQWDAQASAALSRKITKAMQSLLKRVDPC